jgi:predicted metal-dependent phosphoesterase TrpH
MPARSPFTRLCQQVAALRAPARADLHVHSTHSDGLFTPAEVVERAKKAGLFAVALADHDTLSGFGEALATADGRLEVVPGVEITSEFEGTELHLLGYFVHPDDPELNAALARLREQRVERFAAMAGRLKARGVSLCEKAVSAHVARPATLGRRHLANLMVAAGHVRTVNEAFAVHLTHPEVAGVPKLRLPVAEAIRLVRQAGGVASWAHPPADFTLAQLHELQRLGLRAVEWEYPWPSAKHPRRLREAARQLGLLATGGSDCHGPFPASRLVGCRGVTRDQFEQLRAESAREAGTPKASA